MKHTKILVFLAMLLTAALTLCACGLFNSGNGNTDPQTTTKTYEYSFNIGENSIKYVAVVTKEGNNSPKSELQIYLNDVKINLSEPIFSFADDDMTTLDVGGLNFALSDDGKMVYTSGLSPNLINPYEAFAGEYNFENEYTITLTADGKASASVNSELVLDYYPVDFEKIIVVKDGNGYVYRIQSDNTIWQQEGVAAGVTAENLTAYYNMLFSTDPYWGEGYFYDAHLYTNGEKCVIVGPFFVVLDYTERDGVLTTAQGNFKIDDNKFDFVVAKELKSDASVLKIYENGMAYFNTTEDIGVDSGRYEAMDTEGFADIGGAIYDYHYRKTFVFDTELNYIYNVEGEKFIYLDSYKKYMSDSVEFYFNEDLTEGCYLYDDSIVKSYFPIITKNKLCDNLILAENGNVYALSDDGNIGSTFASNLGNIDMFLSPDSCVMKTLDYTNEGDYVFEDRVYFIIEKGDDVLYIEWAVTTGYLSGSNYYNTSKFDDIVTDGAHFIKVTDTTMTTMSLNRHETLIDGSVQINDYADGYITVSHGARHYFVNKETLTLDFCIEDENFAQNVANIDFGKYIINMETREIYATLYDKVYNSSVYIYVPMELVAVPLFDGLYNYRTDSAWYNSYVFIWDNSPEYYYYSTNWEAWEKNEESEPDSVENFRNVRNEPDDIQFGNNNLQISICHYGDTVKMYIAAFDYSEQDNVVLNFYPTVIEGTYAYDEANDIITVTATDYVYTISTVIADVDYQYKTFTRTAVEAE